jgi:DNA-binding GntR family transcriptional regulator
MLVEALTKSAAVIRSLREDISSGEFRPGERLTLRGLSDRYGVSQIPIREALAALERDGLVEIKPHYGARVATISEEELHELQFIRSHLEALAVEATADHLTDLDFQRLDALMEQMDDVAARQDASVYAALNRQFHHALYSACPYRKLVAMIETIWDESSRPSVVFALDPARMSRSSKDHRAIVNALRRGDAAKARGLMLDHKFAAGDVARTLAMNERTDRTQRSRSNARGRSRRRTDRAG